MARILAFAGSSRRGSFNKKLVTVAVGYAREAGADVTHVDLRDFPMPLYDGDLEDSDGIPANAEKLYTMMKLHDGLLISSPEYNSSISGLLKNTIDWLSRPRKGDKPLEAFTGKVAGLISASPGALGGLRGLVHVRAILQNIGVIVVPKQMCVSKADDAFNQDGSLKDSATADKVRGVAIQLVETTRRLER